MSTATQILEDGSIIKKHGTIIFAVSDPLKFFSQLNPVQNLRKGYLPVISTEVKENSITYRLESFSWKVKEKIIDFTRIKIRNYEKQKNKATFWIGVKGYDYTTERILYGEYRDVQHGDDWVSVNGQLLYLLEPAPDRIMEVSPNIELFDKQIRQFGDILRNFIPQESGWNKIRYNDHYYKNQSHYDC